MRNNERALARSGALLQELELESVHLLTNAVRDFDRNYQVSQTTLNRRIAAAKELEAVKARYDAGEMTLDMLLDAQRRLADAEIGYYRALVDYNIAIHANSLPQGLVVGTPRHPAGRRAWGWFRRPQEAIMPGGCGNRRKRFATQAMPAIGKDFLKPSYAASVPWHLSIASEPA